MNGLGISKFCEVVDGMERIVYKCVGEVGRFPAGDEVLPWKMVALPRWRHLVELDSADSASKIRSV